MMDITKIRTPELESETILSLWIAGEWDNADRLINWLERRDKYIHRNCGKNHRNCGSRAPSIWECSIFACFFVLTAYFL